MYYKVHYTEVPAEEVVGAEGGVTIRWLLHKDIGVPNYEMRLFEFPVGARMAPHRHSWEHEIYVIDGEGTLTVAGEPVNTKPGDALFIPGDVIHGYENTGKTTWKFLCIIPKRK